MSHDIMTLIVTKLDHGIYNLFAWIDCDESMQISKFADIARHTINSHWVEMERT